MEPGKIASQMINFQKTVFENNFKALMMVQDQAEQMGNTLMAQMPWVNEDGKKAVMDAMAFYKKARDDYKKSADEWFVKMEEMFTQKGF